MNYYIENLNIIIEQLKKAIKERKRPDYYKEREELHELFTRYENNKEQLQKAIEEHDKKTREERDKQQKNNVKIDLLSDNIFYIIYNCMFEDVKQIFLKDYVNKNMGEATAEKFTNEVNNYLRKKYQNETISLYFYRHNNYNDLWQYTFSISLELDALRYEKVNQNNTMYYNFDKEQNYFTYYKNTCNYTELNKINKTINYIIKTTEKLEQEKEELNKKIDNFNQTMGTITRSDYNFKRL